MHVEIVDGELPAEETVVNDGDRDGAGDTVVGEHVGQHRDLVVEGRGGPDEPVDLGGDGAAGEPADKGVEEQPARKKDDGQHLCHQEQEQTRMRRAGRDNSL